MRAIAECVLNIHKAPVLPNAESHVAGMACQPRNPWTAYMVQDKITWFRIKMKEIAGRRRFPLLARVALPACHPFQHLGIPPAGYDMGPVSANETG